jgi:DNA mismatch repair protein MutS2
MESINVKIKQVGGYQELYDSNKKTIYIGQKVRYEKYFNNKNKERVGEFFENIEIENSKRKKSIKNQSYCSQRRK